MLRASVASLPESIEIKPGKIRLKFKAPIEAFQPLYYLNLALHSDIASFERSQRTPRIFNYLDIQPDIRMFRYPDIWDGGQGNLLRYL